MYKEGILNFGRALAHIHNSVWPLYETLVINFLWLQKSWK